jgi:hypothetical protein
LGGRSAVGRRRIESYLEPSHAGPAVAFALLACCMFAGFGAALVYRRRGWPDELQLGIDVPDRVPVLLGGLAALAAIVCVVLAVYHADRWARSRSAAAVPDDPAVARHLPVIALPPPASATTATPPLAVDVVDPRDLDEVQPMPVTTSANVAGLPPVRIAALRAFENQPRLRTLLQGSWREVGPLVVLRSVASLSPDELQGARGHLSRLFAGSPAELASFDQRPVPPGRRSLRGIARQPVRVHDPHGAYPALGYLGDGASWAQAQDVVVGGADLVVVDLAGMSPTHPGAGVDLRQLLDRVPIERVCVLVDPRTDVDVVTGALRAAWQRLAGDSPNAGPAPRRALVAVTDRVVRHDGGRGDRPVHVLLRARRAASRRLAVLAQRRASVQGR